jgi:dTDP-4-dehydrorhamnose reductase
MAARLILIGASGALGAVTLAAARRSGLATIATYGSRPFEGGVRFRAEADSLARLGVTAGDTVILFAAYSDQEWVRTHADEARFLNVAATIRLAEEARGAGARFIFLSSEAVFGADRTDGWPEGAAPCPTTEYGRQKAEAEKMLLAFDNICIVRTGWNVTDRMMDRCVLRSTYQELLSGSARLAQDNVISLTFAGDTAQCLVRVSVQNVIGVVHAVSGIPISRTDMADEIMRASRGGCKMHYQTTLHRDLMFLEPRVGCAWLTATRNCALGIDCFLPPQEVIRRKVALLDEAYLGC